MKRYDTNFPHDAKDLVAESVCGKRAVNEMAEIPRVDIRKNIATTAGRVGSPLRSKFGILMRLDYIVEPERVDISAGSCVKAATTNFVANFGHVDVIGCMLIDPAWNDEEKMDKIVASGFDPMYNELAQPPYEFFLANARRFKAVIQCPGQLKIWKVKPEIQAHIEGLSESDYLPRRTFITDAEPTFEMLPTKPLGVVKSLGKPNYSELDRKTKAKIGSN